MNKEKQKKTDKTDPKRESEKLFSELIGIMEKLRSPGGCLWDREQTHESIKKNMIEEAYEALDSIEKNDITGLREELGDILLQVVFHSQISKDEGEFEISDVIRSIVEKLIRRHPHVFGETDVSSSGEVLANWEDIKKKERIEKGKKSDSIFNGIPIILPSLHYAHEIQSRAARLGFDWDDIREVLKKISEEIGELQEELHADNKKRLSEELGDLLFSIVNLSRHLGIDSEQSLRGTCRKFIERFDYMEKYAKAEGIDFKKSSIAEKDELWEIAKKNL